MPGCGGGPDDSSGGADESGGGPITPTAVRMTPADAVAQAPGGPLLFGIYSNIVDVSGQRHSLGRTEPHLVGYGSGTRSHGTGMLLYAAAGGSPSLR